MPSDEVIEPKTPVLRHCKLGHHLAVMNNGPAMSCGKNVTNRRIVNGITLFQSRLIAVNHKGDLLQRKKTNAQR